MVLKISFTLFMKVCDLKLTTTFLTWSATWSKWFVWKYWY